ncbi:hypothetical protein FPRO06_11978 [Fusarium proliferatum]|uniref:Uncharacterized protein n=1 Tax=Fusarium proliferatum (strain ET1) TaxID=1227346 RepID=A0A1L7VA70_FUSPR|nr:uncharacterized protein FPRO_07146 [Fusarium proliferatum ET1]KAG4292490.1 hypothetical protein FPRO06_11978 [Fusarium proliferatum]CVL13585.1 uncharacterized protein FPRN_06974 [Fusarium proliferatum]CZR37663.1 uncharacterized protein FPRO_07146 [Fusarium proliferatum ET1]
MFENQSQWNRAPGPAGTYTWTQVPQKPDPALSNNYYNTQPSNCPDDWSHLFDTNHQRESSSHEQFQSDQTNDHSYSNLLPSIPPSVSPMATGHIQPCNLNIVLKSDQADTSAQSSELRARLERLERILDGLQASLADLTRTVETKSSGFEEDVANSLGAITKGMEKFFNRFASHLEDEEIKLAEARITQVEMAPM